MGSNAKYKFIRNATNRQYFIVVALSGELCFALLKKTHKNYHKLYAIPKYNVYDYEQFNNLNLDFIEPVVIKKALELGWIKKISLWDRVIDFLNMTFTRK